jgi:Phosphotransferase enzyme family
MLSTRVDWASLPPVVRKHIESLLGSSVRRVSAVPGGFSPGFIGKIVLEDERTLFVKLSSTALNARTPTMHSREAEVLRYLPALDVRPRLIATVADRGSGWSGLITTFVKGSGLGISDADVEAAFVLLHRIADCETPLALRPLETVLESDFLWFGIRRLLERDGSIGGDWSESDTTRLLSYEGYFQGALHGHDLVHGDMRADNVLLDTRNRAVAVDWPAAARGNSAFDVVMLCASLAQQGGPVPGDLLARNERYRSADPDMITVLIVGLFGHYAWASSLGDPPAIGGVRAYQASMANILAGWLNDRLR